MDTAHVFAIHAYMLLKKGAALARKAVDDYKPRFADKKEYSDYLEGLCGVR